MTTEENGEDALPYAATSPRNRHETVASSDGVEERFVSSSVSLAASRRGPELYIKVVGDHNFDQILHP